MLNATLGIIIHDSKRNLLLMTWTSFERKHKRVVFATKMLFCVYDRVRAKDQIPLNNYHKQLFSLNFEFYTVHTSNIEFHIPKKRRRRETKKYS